MARTIRKSKNRKADPAVIRRQARLMREAIRQAQAAAAQEEEVSA